MSVEIAVFVGLLVAVTVAGFAAAHWRRPRTIHDLEEWGVGGRAFGNWVTWFLLGGSMFTAYTFVAVPALTYGAGAVGFFSVPFAIVITPIAYLVGTRIWSVSHARGFVTSSEFAGARFGSPTLAAVVAVTGIAATVPYVSVQLVSLRALFETLGVNGDWPLLVAVGLVSITTFRSGLRAPALLSIGKDIFLVWVVLAAILVVAMSGGWGRAFDLASVRFRATPTPADGVVLPHSGQMGYLTLVIGSALSIFAYPHAVTALLAAKDRATVKRNTAALPIYALALALMALLGFFAVSQGVRPVGGDLNTVVPRLFHALFPAWTAGIGYAAIAVAALIPAAVMSIAAANLFTRSIYRQYLNPDASARQEARVSRWSSLAVKFLAAALLLLISPSFSVQLQLIGGVIILQIIPAVFIGLWTAWFHRWALIAGLAAGLLTGVVMLYRVPQYGPDGRIADAHFGGSNWNLPGVGDVYVGLLALALNLAIVVLLTIACRIAGLAGGPDSTAPDDYFKDADDPTLKRLDDLLDGLPRSTVGAHERR